MPSALPTCVVSGVLYDDTNPVPTGTPVYYRLVSPPPIAGLAYTGASKEVLTDGSGNFSVTCWQNAEYQFWVGSGEHQTVLTGTNTEIDCPPLMGGQTPPP